MAIKKRKSTKKYVKYVLKWKVNKKTGKRTPAKWGKKSITLWRSQHNVGDDGRFHKVPRPPKIHARASQGGKLANPMPAKYGIEPFSETAENSDGTFSHVWIEPTGIGYDSPMHTPEIMASRARAVLFEKAKEVEYLLPSHYRGGVYCALSKKDNKNGSPRWQKELFPNTTAYSTRLDVAARQAAEKVGAALQKAGSLGSGRVWIKAIFVEIKTEYSGKGNPQIKKVSNYE